MFDPDKFKQLVGGLLRVPDEEEERLELDRSVAKADSRMVTTLMRGVDKLSPLQVGPPWDRTSLALYAVQQADDSESGQREADYRSKLEQHRRTMHFFNPFAGFAWMLKRLWLKRPRMSGRRSGSTNRLSENQDDQEEQEVEDEDRDWPRKPRVFATRYFLIYLYSLYAMIKYFVTGWISREFDKSLYKWQPQVRAGANRTWQCALPRDIYEPDLKLRANIDWRRKFLVNQSFKLIHTIDVFTFMCYGVSLAYFILLWSAFNNRRREFQLDALSFIYTPLTEVARVKRRVAELIHSSFASMDNYQSELRAALEMFARTKNQTGDEANLNAQFGASPGNTPDSSIGPSLLTTAGLSSRSATMSASSCSSRLTYRGNRGILPDLNKIPDDPNADLSYLVAKNCNCRFSEHLDKADLYKYIERENLGQYLKPANMRAKVHQNLVKIRARTIRKFAIVLALTLMTLSFWNLLYEGGLRVETRLALYNCKRWHKNATLIKDITMQGPLSRKEIYNFSKFKEQTSWAYYRLVFKLQMFDIFDLAALVMALDFGLSVLILTIWIVFYLINYATNIHSATVWILQVQGQMRNCIKLLEMSKLYLVLDEDNLRNKARNKRRAQRRAQEQAQAEGKQQHPEEKSETGSAVNSSEAGAGKVDQLISISETVSLASSSAARQQRPGSMDKVQMRELFKAQLDFEPKQELEKSLTITYLNFELFKSEYATYHQVQDYVANILGVYSILLVITTLLISTSHSHRIIWATTMISVVCLNIIIVTSVAMTKRLQRLYALISQLLAKSTDCGLELTYIVKRWRRRLMTTNEIHNIYATQVLSFKLAHSSLLTFNTGLMAIWLLLHRFSYYRDS